MIVLVLGGTRSGKSEVAERIAARDGSPVTCVATARTDDSAFAARIAAHRARRPAGWQTIETTDLAESLRSTAGAVLVDSLGTWVAAYDFEPDVDALCGALVERVGLTVLVSEEVGLGVHAPTELGVRFADAVGDCNRQVASIADQVLLVVAGRTLALGREEL